MLNIFNKPKILWLTCMIIVAAIFIRYVQQYSGHDENTAHHSCCQGSERYCPANRNIVANVAWVSDETFIVGSADSKIAKKNSCFYDNHATSFRSRSLCIIQ